MKAFILAILIGIPAAQINTRKVAAKDMKYSVVIHIKGTRRNKHGEKERVMAGCSGTYIGPYTILTAAHCFQFEEPTQIWVRDQNEVIGIPAELRARSVSKDLAILSVPYPHAYAKLGAYPKVGDRVLNVGSPLFFEFVASEGIVGIPHMYLPGERASYLLTTAKIDFGSSGGGAFNSQCRLVGVNTMMVRGWTIAVDIDTVRKFIEELEQYGS